MKEGMHNLMGKYLSGEITPSESTALMEWVDADEKNKEEFAAVQELWAASADVHIPVFNTDETWNKLNRQLDPFARKAKLFTIGRVAAGIAAAFIIVLGIWLLRGDDMKSVTASAAVEKLSLPDGSFVYLRKGSKLKYPRKFTDDREVSLTGEAFFNVAHDSRHPFTIQAGEANVRVVGTSFSVIETDKQVQLIVKSGKVRFFDKGDTSRQLLVVAGERALLKEHALTKTINQDVNFNAWQSKQLVFNNTPLSQVVNSLKDNYRVNIMLHPADSIKLSANQITASFNDQPIENVLKELALIGDLRIEEKRQGEYEIHLK
jgi:transmembrane sensor